MAESYYFISSNNPFLSVAWDKYIYIMLLSKYECLEHAYKISREYFKF